MTLDKVKWLVAGLVCLALWPVSAVADVAAWQRHSDAAVEAFVKGDTAEAEKKFKAAITEAEGLGPDSPQLATSLYSLGRLYFTQGKHAVAQPLFERALMIVEKNFGPNHATVAGHLENLANLYRTQGRGADAGPLLKRALTIRKQAKASEALATAQQATWEQYMRAGVVAYRRGVYSEAENQWNAGLGVAEAFGTQDPRYATSLTNLAALYHVQGRYGDAEPLIKRSLSIRQKALGPDHPDVATSLNELAVLYKAQGRNAEAEPLYKRALAIYEKTLGPDHPHVATSLNNLAELYRAQGRFGEAEPPFKRSLGIFEKTLGPDHPDVAGNLNNLALLYIDQGRFGDAEPLFKRSLAIREKALGPDHPDTATGLNNLGGIYRAQGKYAEAEPLYKRALAIRERTLGPKHPHVAQSLTVYAALLRQTGRGAEADGLEARVSPARVGELGDSARIVFEGVRTFSDKAVRDALTENWEVLRSSHRGAPLGDYLETLRKKVLIGYRHAGFPETNVTTKIDKESNKIVVAVAEGPRYTSGGVSVVGAKTVPVDTLIRRLTETDGAPESTTSAFRFEKLVLESPGFLESPRLGGQRLKNDRKAREPETPIWHEGRPAPFDKSSLERLESRMTTALHEMGYFLTKANIRVIPEKGNGTAKLMIEISDEGPRDIIDETVVTGNTKNTSQEILEFLALAPGMAITRDVITEAKDRLWRSARFLDFDVTTVRPVANEPRVKLKIKLTEYALAPPLFKDFSETETTLLKLRNWLSRAPSSERDIVISLRRSASSPTGELVRTIISRKGAIVVTGEGKQPPELAPPERPPAFRANRAKPTPASPAPAPPPLPSEPATIAEVPKATPSPGRPPTPEPGPTPPSAPATGEVERPGIELGQAAEIIREIVVEGVHRIEPDTVRAYLLIQEGDPFDPRRIDPSLKNLFATGLFADVTLRRRGDVVIVTVIENPVINRVAFEGNDKLSDEILEAEISLRPRVIYTRTKVRNDVTRILTFYRRAGHFAATVEPKVIPLPQNRLDLLFEINEGELTEIRQIRFVGNRAFSEALLRDVIRTKETRSGRVPTADEIYDPDRLMFDRELLRRFYLTNGYADFRVVSAAAERTPDRKDHFITFTVDEGARYRFGKIDIDARLRDLKVEDIAESIEFEEGDWYDLELVIAAIDELTNKVGELGYAFVDVRPRISRYRENQTIAIVFEVNEGPRVFVERIDIVGNVRTLDEIIRRELLLVESGPFSQAKLDRSLQRIRKLDYFENVEVKQFAGSAPDKTVIVVEVEEKSTGELSFRAGISTIKGPMFDVSILERNLLGRGKGLGLSFKVSGLGRGFDLSFVEPCLGPCLGPPPVPGLTPEATRARPLPPDATRLPLPAVKKPEAPEDKVAVQGNTFDADSRTLTNIRYAAVLSPEMVALFDLVRGRKLVDTGRGWQFQGNASILPVRGPQGAQRFGMSFDAGVNTPAAENSQPPFRFDILVAPSVFLAAAQSKHHSFEINDGVLTITSAHDRIKIDVVSGRLIEFVGSVPEDSVDLRVEVLKGAFDRTLSEIETATQSHRDFMDPKSPLNSWLSYAIAEFTQSRLIDSSVFAENMGARPREILKRLVPMGGALRKVFAKGLLTPFDDFMARHSNGQRDGFDIPADSSKPMEMTAEFLGSALSALGYKFADDFFAKGSWPWVMAREASFLVGGERRYLEAGLNEVYESAETGPLGYLAIAALLKSANQPAAAVSFAERGRQRLAVADFRNDVRLFLEGESLIVQTFERVAEALRELDDEEIEGLATGLFPNNRALVRRVVRLLRDGKAKSVYEALSPNLGDIWNSTLKEVIATELRALATTKVAGKAPQTAAGKAESATAKTEQAAVPAAGEALKLGRVQQVVFAADVSELPIVAEDGLSALSKKLKDNGNLRLQLLAYAGGKGLSASKARRLSLSRALSVRSFLINNGVHSTRIDVHVFGDKTTEEPVNRVDLNIIEQ